MENINEIKFSGTIERLKSVNTKSGRGSINSWKDNEDRWHNDFQLSVWEVESDGSSVKYEKNTDTGGRPHKNTAPLPPQQKTQDTSQYDHKSVPF